MWRVLFVNREFFVCSDKKFLIILLLLFFILKGNSVTFHSLFLCTIVLPIIVSEQTQLVPRFFWRSIVKIFWNWNQFSNIARYIIFVCINFSVNSVWLYCSMNKMVRTVLWNECRTGKCSAYHKISDFFFLILGRFLHK